MKTFLYCILLVSPLLCFGQPLAANQVFQFEAKTLDANALLLKWTIKPGYFLYKNRIKISAQPNSSFHIGTYKLPPSQLKIDSQNHPHEVYRSELNQIIPVLGTQPGEAIMDIRFQGCSDDGFCYPPKHQRLKLSFSKEKMLTQLSLEPPTLENFKKAILINPIETIVSNNNMVLVILGFLGLGLLLSFTPCVLPMIPVLSGLIIGHGNNLSTRKAFFLSLCYVLSMSITYAVFGAVLASMGHNLQITMQSPWVISLFSLVFAVLALSMFNVYHLRLPLSWQNKLANISRKSTGGHYLNAAIMGCLSTLILSPCVSPPLIGVLGYITQSGNVFLGSLGLFFIGLGMGVPLLLIGTSAGKLLPKTGLWMNAVQSFFGFLLLAVAIYLLERILPAPVVMTLWGGLFVFSGVFLNPFTRPSTVGEKMRQSLAIILLLYGLLILIGASIGNSNLLQPLAPPANPLSTNNSPMIKVVQTLQEVKSAMSQSQEMPILLDFYADWCTECKIIESTTLKNPLIKTLLKQFLVLKIDITANNADSKALLKYFNVIAPPAFLFFKANGQEIDSLRTFGAVSTDEFARKLNEPLINN